MAKDELLSPAQFLALSDLLPKPKRGDGATREAARLVLVGGMRKADAARLTGISPSNVNDGVARFERVLALSKIAASL